MINIPDILAAGDTFLLPRPASDYARQVDVAWNALFWITGFFFCIIVVAMTFFIIKYRRRTPDDRTSNVTHNTPLEVLWTGVPLVLVIVFFYIGFRGFLAYDQPPTNPKAVVDVQAQKWSFSFSYPNGAVDNSLYLEKGVQTVLNLTSKDVLHGLYIPAFRIQRNLIPYRTTTMWVLPTDYSPAPNPRADDPGGFSAFCTQYCGDGHSTMMARVHVLDHDAYEQKMKELANPFKKKNPAGKWEYVPYAKLGASLFVQIGCSSCHTVDEAASRTRTTGPTWWHLWKSDVKFSASNVPGYTLSPTDPDEKWVEYVRESVLRPEAKIVDGYSNAMPSFAAQLSGSEPNDERLRAIVEYIKSIGNQRYTPAVPPNSELYDADKYVFHPESLRAATRPAATSDAP